VQNVRKLKQKLEVASNSDNPAPTSKNVSFHNPQAMSCLRLDNPHPTPPAKQNQHACAFATFPHTTVAQLAKEELREEKKPKIQDEGEEITGFVGPQVKTLGIR